MTGDDLENDDHHEDYDPRMEIMWIRLGCSLTAIVATALTILFVWWTAS